MVEAAFVFPLIILSVVALIHILIFFVQVTKEGTVMHLALRCESGRISDTLQYEKQIDGRFPIYRKGDRVYFQGDIVFADKGILRKLKKKITAYKYIDNETDWIRKIDLIKEKKANNDE